MTRFVSNSLAALAAIILALTSIGMVATVPPAHADVYATSVELA